MASIIQKQKELEEAKARAAQKLNQVRFVLCVWYVVVWVRFWGLWWCCCCSPRRRGVWCPPLVSAAQAAAAAERRRKRERTRGAFCDFVVFCG